jgi:hypothetical protein
MGIKGHINEVSRRIEQEKKQGNVFGSGANRVHAPEGTPKKDILNAIASRQQGSKLTAPTAQAAHKPKAKQPNM